MGKKLEKGLVHIYTGDGKGKTTAAIGQGVRSFGGGLKVLMVQFLKGDDTGELHSFERLGEGFTLKRFAALNNFYKFLPEGDKLKAKEDATEGLRYIKAAMEQNQYDLIIMDEIMATITNEMVMLEEVIELVKNKPVNLEMIMTGRNAPEELMVLANYVTEMKLIKHPFQQGIYARKGIES